MAVVDTRNRVIEAKLVYYGTPLGGKTTNLMVLHRLAEADQKQKLVSLNTSGDRTLFFDLLPFDLGKVLDWRIKLKLYTVPGQPEYGETRRVVLAGADAVVFVADSSPDRHAENVRAINFFKLNLKQNHIDQETMPLVFQYNKRDRPMAMPSAVLEGDLNWRGAPYFLATALKGRGVVQTFESLVVQLVQSLRERYGMRTPVNSPEDLQRAVHDRLRPLFERRARWDTKTEVVPESSAHHVVVRADKLTQPEGVLADMASPGKVVDTEDLLEMALESEMHFLGEMLDQESESAQDAASGPALMSAESLSEALAAAGRAPGLEATAAPLLALATQVAGVHHGSVMVLTPGQGRLAELARRGLERDPLNQSTTPGAPPQSRRLATEAKASYGEALRRQTLGARAARSGVPVPHALVPLVALGRRLGLLVLYSVRETPEPEPARRESLELLAIALSLSLALRGTELRLASSKKPARVAAVS